ncbi:MAG: TadE/TadG family type IV pilus assembly protein [Candidatus Sulfotelmatobacter sp.]
MNKMAKPGSCRGREQRRAATLCHTMRCENAGQALVELALALPFFLLLIMGTFEFGRLAYISMEVANAANAGAHYGAQNHITASDTAGMQLAAQSDAANMEGLSATAIYFCACSNVAGSPTQTLGTGCKTTCTSPGILLEYVKVSTSATVAPVTAFTTAKFKLQGQAIVRVEQ